MEAALRVRMRVLVVLASLVFIVFAMRIASPVLGPVALAATLAIAFEPFAIGLQRRGLSRGVAAAFTSLLMLLVVIGMLVLVLQAAFDLSSHVPAYAETLRTQAAEWINWLERRGLGSLATRLRSGDPGGGAAAFAEQAAASALSLTQASILVLLITAFIQLDAPALRAALSKRFRQGPSTEGGVNPESIIDDGLGEIRRYIIVKGCLSLVGGAALGAWCWAWGVEGALVWGTVAFLFNFVPIVGSLISAVPPVLLAFVTAGPGAALGVASGYIAVNLLVDNIIEPRVMGRAVGLSPLVVLIAMAVWGFVLGPIGALLSVPLTIALRTVLMASGLSWIEPLLSDAPIALAPARHPHAPAHASAHAPAHASAQGDVAALLPP
jgi:AI-2 transport protein TqsA